MKKFTFDNIISYLLTFAWKLLLNLTIYYYIIGKEIKAAILRKIFIG